MTTIIVKYSNRKYYDTNQSRYVTLEELAHLVKINTSFAVVDHKSDEDITNQTLMAVLFYQNKNTTDLSTDDIRRLIKIA